MKILRFFSSLKLTAILLALLGMLMLAGQWIPQKSLLRREMYEHWQQGSPALVSVLETLRFTEIYTAPLTLAVWGLFFINLTTVMVRRIGVIGKRTKLPSADDPLPATAGFPYQGRLKLLRSDRAELYRSLEQKGFHVVPSGEGFIALKNRFSPLAAILFHLSFYLILAGASLSVYTKFSATLNIAEGESFSGEVTAYAAPPKLAKVGAPPKLQFTLLKVVPEVKESTSTSLSVTLRDAAGQIRAVGINRPYKQGATSLVVKNLGVSPLFVLSRGGEEIDGAFVKLDVLKGKTDRFAIGPYTVLARYFPDYEVVAGQAQTRSEEFRNPALQLKVLQGEELLTEGTLQPGQGLAVGSERLELREIPFWVGFSVVKEHGLPVLYAGFLLGVVALCWHFGIYQRLLVGRYQEGDSLLVAGRADLYRALTAEEFETMFRDMESVVSVE
jgi:hypothetical protein